MVTAWDAIWSTILLFTCITSFQTSVPPTPPAKPGETTTQLGFWRKFAIAQMSSVTFIRIICQHRVDAFIVRLIFSSFMLLDAYKAATRGRYHDDPLNLWSQICPTSVRTSNSSGTLSTAAFIGFGLLLFGSSFRIAAQRTLGPLFTWELAVKSEHRLVTTGPYAIVRHPAYLGLWIMRLGVTILQFLGEGTVFYACVRPQAGWAGTIWLWENVALTLTTFYWMGIRLPEEDRLMRKHFGEEWLQWSKKTPWKVVPFVY